MNPVDRNTLNIRADIERLVRKESPVDTVLEDTLAPNIPVSAASGSMPVLEEGTHKKALDNKRAKGGTFVRSSFSFGEDSFQTEMYGNEVPIDVAEKKGVKAKYKNLDLLTESGIHVRNILLQSRKVRIANKIMSTDIWTGSDYVSTPSTKFDDTGGLDSAIAEIKAGCDKVKARTGMGQKSCWVGMTSDAIFNFIDQMVESDRFKYTDNLTLATDQVQRDAIAKVLRVGGVTVLDGQFNDASFEATEASFTDIYDTDKIIIYIPTKGRSLETVTGTFFQPVFTDWAKNYLFDTRINRDIMAEVLRVSEWRGIKVNPKYGFLLNGCFT